MFPSFPYLPPKNQVDTILEMDPFGKRRISVIYKLIQSLRPITWEKIKENWEKDIGVDLSDDEWRSCLNRIHTSSLCIRHGLIQFKILHRLHYTRERLSKFFPEVDPACPRCGHNSANEGHMMWCCPNLDNYWGNIFKVLSHISAQNLVLDFRIGIFGVMPSQYKISKSQENAIAFATLLAHRLILFHWKSDKAPSYIQWLKEVLFFLPLEKLRYRVLSSQQIFSATWNPFIDYIKTHFPDV